MLTGLNHLTLAVRDLQRSLAFYRDVLQLNVEATWDNGAYLSLPGLWLCLSERSSAQWGAGRGLYPLRFERERGRFHFTG